MLAKYNVNRLKPGRRNEWRQTLAEEVEKNMGKVKGFAVMDSASDEQEIVVLTFWETREDMDAFYSLGNKIVASFLEKARPFMEGAPERRDYSVPVMIMQQ